ncbi:MAG: GAF domain-containing sensor histidine kinase [Acidobacteriota bacterium]
MADLKRLRWLGVWLPVVGIGLLIALVAVFIFYPHMGWRSSVVAYLMTMGIVTTGAYLFSHFIFRIVQQKEQEILRRNQELAALNAVGAVINESLDLDAVLNRALEKVLDVTGADAGEIFLGEEGSGDLVQHAFRGLFVEAFREITRFKLNEGFPGVIAQAGKPIVVHDLHRDPRFLRKRVKEAGFRSFAGVPLRSKGRVVGVMGIACLQAGRLTSEDVNLLAVLGNQIGIAIENARLYAQLREMTTLEERQRIAREMHDGLAQELGYLHLKLGELEEGISSKSPSTLREELAQMKKVVEGAYEDVRQAIFGLKMMVSRGLGLIPTLAEYLHEFGEQTGIAVKLKIPDERATRLSPHAEVQLIRIIQEALANVRKHAQARQAWVTLEAEGVLAKVTIRDNGKGFQTGEAAGSGRATFGLQTMQERAESVSGTLEVKSQPGQGTEVTVHLPLRKQEVVSWTS